ncbi:N-methyl-L-tryptophan oxidase [Streptomyces europaeiscabiei]|uniref:N-methyl-L-tryptophan oxidase n=1 Tax=Streptomyces europaeiscabiei TaxID=146819 RepID=A0ABU4NQ43_9ACTN|nr:N-methyl-L-tryptophan oxidase [Streptomyces europaeiscabiei]MDX2530869.1 N-methyl-L-tryptophan oxidase [Streptomyces europaeiscabiei]MDX2758749.1 N-methyl-L-tryptophan oxidase [Streptomyces europaeiscabiei]MDX2769712.1 N-methyl-L-tryptophan oxidase [Streptomyces europaeiscabiei]MDX3547675.1 N-methyl-L-tryptophan oxidase [Streptomyces europaeiscabiei]MDX3557152.1 N-methyl-L-tryptophan oxidase [Streptomyces europaeiscabiei]
MRIPKRVAVIGAGSMGSQAMWRLAARGAEVIGYDRYAPGHDRGAAGGESRIFRSAHLGEPGYIPLLRLADGLWEQLQAETGRTLRRRSGCLVMGETASPAMRLLLSSSAAHLLDHEVLEREELARRYPQHRLPDGHAAVLDRMGAIIRPEASVQAAATHAEQLGARLHRYTPVREIAPASGGGVQIVTDQGTDHVDAAVVTVGPWINTLLPDLPRSIEVRRVVCSWHLPTRHDWFTGGAPPFVRATPHDCFGLPSPDGVSVKLGLSFARHLPVPEPERLDRTVRRPEELGTFHEVIAELMPDLNPDPIRMSAYMEGYTESKNPLVGHLPGEDDIIVMAGFSGNGFKLSPAMGEIAADLALDGTTDHPIDFLAPAGVGAA